MASLSDPAPLLPRSMRALLDAWLRRVLGYVLLAVCVAGAVSLLTWSATDPSFSRATDAPTRNLLGPIGAVFSDLAIRLFGLAGVFLILPPTFWALQLITRRRLESARLKLTLAPLAVLSLACAASSLPRVAAWPLPFGLGGFLGDQASKPVRSLLATVGPERVTLAAGLLCFAVGLILLLASLGLSPRDLKLMYHDRRTFRFRLLAHAWRRLGGILDRGGAARPVRLEPTLGMPPHSLAMDRMAAWRAGPSFDRELQPSFAEGARDAEFEGTTERECHAMARRFAPDRDAPPGGGASKFRLRRMPGLGPARGPRSKGKVGHKPVWPGSVPAAAESPPHDQYPYRRAADDELYGRAVAVVFAGRKASTEFLQRQLSIGYMRAADLIERMEHEGILGAPIRNGTRPILGRVRRSRVV